MKWAVLDKSVPSLVPAVANRKNKLVAKIGLKNLLEFLCLFSYKEKDSSNNSYFFQSAPSNNIDRNKKSLQEITVFTELYLLLSYKGQKSSLRRRSKIIETCSASANVHLIKVLDEA